MDFYDMDGNPIRGDDEPGNEHGVLSWGRYMEATRKDGSFRIGLDSARGFSISTVYLGANHAFHDGPPLIFETMIFFPRGGEAYCERYSTKEEARAGHERAVERVRAGEFTYLLPSGPYG